MNSTHSSDADDTSPQKGIEHRKQNHRERILAVCRFLAFAAAMALILVAINAVLRMIPSTARLLEEAQTGTLSAPLLVVLDGTGFLALLLLSGLVAMIQRESLSAYGLPPREAFQKRFWQGLAWGFSLAFLDIGVTHLLNGFSFGTLALSPKYIVGYGLSWGVGFVIVGLFEEYLYRGYALCALKTGLGFWPASLVLSVLFGGLHLMNPGETVIGALDVIIYSLFACFTLRRTGSLWFAVGLHSGWDFSLTFVYSVPASGVRAAGHLLQSSLHGPTWLTGGSAGPEGSAIGLVVLAAAVCVFRIRCIGLGLDRVQRESVRAGH